MKWLSGDCINFALAMWCAIALSLKCAQNIHGHNYEVEVFIETNRLDNANMALDFGLMQQEMQVFIESFDHAHHFWDKESLEFQRFIENHCVRYVKCSFNLSAESYASCFYTT